MTAEYPGAIWDPSPNYFARDGHAVKAIVYHTEAGHEAGTDAEFENSASQVSAHFSVALDGTVRQFVALDQAAWHAGGSWPDGTNANKVTVGVEREDNADPSTPMTPAQGVAWLHLMGWLCDRFNVPRQIVGNGGSGLISHHLINPDHAGCAGPAVESVAQSFCAHQEDEMTDDFLRALAKDWYWSYRKIRSDQIQGGEDTVNSTVAEMKRAGIEACREEFIAGSGGWDAIVARWAPTTTGGPVPHHDHQVTLTGWTADMHPTA